MDKYLPIGSVVLLDGGDKRVMIYGRQQTAVEDGTQWDYVACLFPEGNIGPEYTFMFNHDQIGQVYYLGLYDEEEIAYRQALLEADDDSE